MQKQSWVVTCLTALILAVGMMGLSAHGAQAGVYDADTEVTYKEYWVHNSQFTGAHTNPGCIDTNPNGTFYIEPVGNCEKVIKLNIPESLSRATRAEIYLDLWRNRTPTYTANGALDKKTSAIFRINNNATWFESHPYGYDWSRTPMVADTVRATDGTGKVIPSTVKSVLELLVQGENTLRFKQTTGLYHIHAIAIRVYFDPNNPLLDGNGQPISVPNGSLTTVGAQNGSFNASAGGNLTVNNDQVTLTANLSTNAKYIEFHGYYRGYDLENDDRDGDQGALDTKWQNRIRNHWHPGGNAEQPLGGTIDHIGTVAATTPGDYSVTWSMAHIQNQQGVKFKIRIVTADNVVREAAGGVSGGFNLQRTGHVFAYTQTNWQDFVLHHGGNRPKIVDTNVILPCDYNANDYNSAWVLGSYWNNPRLILNPAINNQELIIFQGGQDNWTLSVRSINRTHLLPGSNTFRYKYPDGSSGFGQFIEKPGPLVVLKRTSALPADSNPPEIVSRTPAAGATNIAVTSNVQVVLRDTGVGVDLNSLRMFVNGSRVRPNLACVGTDAKEYRLTYTLPASHPNNTTVQVRVEACDLRENCMEDSYTFDTRLSQHSFGNQKSGNGVVQLSPSKSSYNYGENVSLTSTPATDWGFQSRAITIADWADAGRDYRTPVHVAANGFPRLDKRAEVAINFTALFNAIGQPNGFNRDSLRVVEVNSSGQVTDANVPFVFANGSGYNANSNAHGLLTIQMKGSTAANGVRYYQVYWDTTAKSFTPPSHSVPADIEPILRPLVVWQGGAQTQSLGSSPNGPNTTFKVTTSANFMTIFQPLVIYELTTAVIGNGAVTHEPSYTSFAPGDGVVLTATAEAGWVFAGWSGDVVSSEPVLNVVMDQAKSITASFKEIVALNLNQVGQGQVTVDPQKGQYLAGDEVTITAAAAEGWVFTGWSGAVMSEETAITLTLDADTNLTATFTAIRKLTVETQGQGQVTVEPTPAFYLDGDEVTLTATAEVGWVFAGWSGDVTGEEAAITVTLDADKSVTARFLELHTLTTEAVGQGTVAVYPDQADYVHGTAVTLTAVAEAGWAFVGWSGDLSGDANPGTLTMDADKSVTATFAPLYPLTVTVVGEGGAVERTPDQAEYVAGAQVTLTATAAPGWRFTGWSGDAQGNEASIIVTMDSAKAVTAAFVEEEYALTLTAQGQGTLTADPAQPFYRYGDEVTLTATPAQGWFFMGWGGDATGSTNPLTIIIDGDKSVTAQFADVAFTLTANVTGGGEVVVTPNLPHYAPGAQVAVEARPEAGWLFMGWSGDLTGNTNPATLIMDGNKSITANFMTEGGRTLAVTVMPQGGGTVTRNPNLPFYENNQTVTLTAQPAEGWFFTGWSGDLSGVNNPATLLMNGNKNVVAHFSKDPLTLAVQVNGRGDVVVTPKKAAYEPGETVTLLAVPDLDSAFHGWGGDASGNANPLTLVMNGAKTITASFIDVDLPSGVVSDSFNRCALNQSAWRFANPAGDGAYALNGKQLLLSAPSGAEHMLWTTYGSPALLQKVGNGNFQLEVKFDSPVDQRFQVQGIVAQADEENWLRANVQSDGNVTTLFVGRKQAGDQPRTVAHIELPNQQPPYYLRMTRSGDRWSVSHSSDGANWLTDDRHNNFKLALAVDEVGLFVGNATTQNGNPARIPAHTAVVDYFRNTAAPATAIADVIPNHLPVMVQGRGLVNKNPLCGSPTTLTAVGDAGWSFVGWSGAASGDGAETQVSFGAGDVVTATFTAAQYTVVVDVVGEGAVEVSPAKATYSHNETITLTANAAPGWRFLAWGGHLSGSEPTVQTPVRRNLRITAAFVEEEVDTVTLTTAVVGGGQVEVTPAQASYLPGAVVTLTAQPAAGWLFVEWSGDLSGDANPATLILNTDKAVTATFVATPAGFVTTNTTGGQVKINPDKPFYAVGDEVTLEAIADQGWRFDQWEVTGGALAAGGQTTQNPLPITVDGERTYTPRFVPDQAGGGDETILYLPVIRR